MKRKIYISDEIKTSINQLFKSLRKKGFIAKQNYLCCSTCAANAIQEQVKNSEKDIKGCIYYHQQDNTHFLTSGKLFLRYGFVEKEDAKVIGLPAEVIGKMIIDELKNVNLKYEWDGNANACIIVHNERRFTADSDGQFKLPI